MPAVWKGSTDIHLQPGYPRFHRDASGASLTFRFRGPYVDLQTYGPDIGDDITLGAFDYEPSGEIVYAESVECQPDEAGDEGPGTLTVVYTNKSDALGIIVSSDTVYEIDWCVLEVKMERHKLWSTGTYVINEANWGKIAQWRDAADGAGRTAAKAGMSTGALAFIARLERGMETYMEFSPVARKTTRGGSPPTSTECGERGDPPGFPSLPDDYGWLKTGDRAIRQGAGGTWERVQEWTGVRDLTSSATDGWDVLLYPEA